MTTSERGRLAFLDRPGQVAAVLTPLRQRILGSLARPASATGLARRFDLPRQKINYHLRELEREGLVELAETRRRRGCVERVLRQTARAYVINPVLLGDLGEDPAQMQDRFSSAYLMAAASRTVRDVGTLRSRADAVEKRLTTLTVESEIAFESPEDLTAFSEELTAAVAALAARYNRPRSQRARTYRFVMGAHPKITKTEKDARAEADAHARDSDKVN